MAVEPPQPSAIIYCRVASAERDDLERNFTSQEKRCRAFAHAQNLPVAGVFRDTGSGLAVERSGMADLLTFLGQHQPGTRILVSDMSRLARGLQQFVTLKRRIADAGGVLVNASDAPLSGPVGGAA